MVSPPPVFGLGMIGAFFRSLVFIFFIILTQGVDDNLIDNRLDDGAVFIGIIHKQARNQVGNGCGAFENLGDPSRNFTLPIRTSQQIKARLGPIGCSYQEIDNSTESPLLLVWTGHPYRSKRYIPPLLSGM